MARADWFDTAGFIDAVHRRMEAERMSCRALAKHIGVTASTLGLVLRGENGPSLPTAAALAVWAGLSLDRFLQERSAGPQLWEGAD